MLKDEILFAQERGTILVLLSILIAFVIYKAISFAIKYRKYKRYQIRLVQKRAIIAEQKARQKAINNFFYNRIEEDIKYIFIKERKWKVWNTYIPKISSIASKNTMKRIMKINFCLSTSVYGVLYRGINYFSAKINSRET